MKTLSYTGGQEDSSTASTGIKHHPQGIHESAKNTPSDILSDIGRAPLEGEGSHSRRMFTTSDQSICSSTNSTPLIHPLHGMKEVPPSLAISPSWPNYGPPPEPNSSSEMELSLLGFGVDPGPNVEDATEAAVRAIQDAMSKSVLSLSKRASHCWQILVKLGVPAKNSGSPETMPIDHLRLTSVLPPMIRVQPIKIVIGGLWVAGQETPGNSTICTVVACVTIQRVPFKPSIASFQPVAPRPLTWSPALREHTKQAPTVEQAIPPIVSHNPMDILARISEEARENQEKGDQAQTSTSSTVQPHTFQHNTFTDTGKYIEEKITESENSPDANIPRCAQHEYTDYANEQPTAMDGAMTLAGRNNNAAFPIKLHEVLSQVEKDGMDHILCWQPHGRSFKIHKQQDFINLILPRYFALTQKSSFQRQLNLYGFNRLVGGPDKGAYYHELFLRNMRFLCRRMTRVKINGNGIRTAGNQDQEPNFYTMPPAMLDNTTSSLTDDDMDDASAITRPNTPVLSSIVESATPKEARSSQALSNHMSFPLKLQSMLDALEAEGSDDVIAWLSHGRGFIVHNQDKFVEELMPKYFRQTKYSSFQRQLHMYSFQRLTSGRDKGAYYHEKFLRNRPRLCQQMVRTRINGKGCRKPSNPHAEPDFYQLPPLPVESDETAFTDEESEQESKLPSRPLFTKIERK